MLSLEERVRMTISCRDCDAIPKVPGAGRVIDRAGERIQIMHNGIAVLADAYYGAWMTEVIAGLAGHHEPQEEAIFHALTDVFRPQSHMIELGAFWSYYALWFLTAVAGSRAVCVEPDPAHLAVGQRNAAFNGLEGRVTFVNAWAGGVSANAVARPVETTGVPLALPQVDVSAVLDQHQLDTVDLLHIDTQGAEVGLIRSIRGHQARVRFVMVSTHHQTISGSATTHRDCLDAIAELGGHVLTAHDIDESFSGDGLIVASFRAADATLPLPVISRNVAARSLFGAA